MVNAKDLAEKIEDFILDSKLPEFDVGSITTDISSNNEEEAGFNLYYNRKNPEEDLIYRVIVKRVR